MQGVRLCLLLLLLASLVPWRIQCQRRVSPGASGEDTDGDLLAVDILDRDGALSRLFPPRYRSTVQLARAPRPASRPRRGQRFSLSLDVPTSILSILLDLAKNQDLRARAAANAELMARIG